MRTTNDGALWEARGCKRWQSTANRLNAGAAGTSQIRCDRLPPLEKLHGKEGVSGSGPGEGSLQKDAQRCGRDRGAAVRHVVPNAGHVDLYDRTDLIPFDKLEAFLTRTWNASRVLAKGSR
jgi:hypothetical protein